MGKPIIGVMGPGLKDDAKSCELAERLGTLIAKAGFLLLTGGRNSGVMDAAAKGAKAAGGTTIGILPSADMSETSEHIDIPIITGMGSARNNINALSSTVLVAVGMGPGTAAEVSLALKADKHVVLLGVSDEAARFFTTLHKDEGAIVHVASDADDAIKQIKGLVPA